MENENKQKKIQELIKPRPLKDPELIKAFKELQSLLVKKELAKLAIQKLKKTAQSLKGKEVGENDNKNHQEQNDDGKMVEEKIEKSTKISIKDAYVKLLAVKLETLMARRHLEKDNEPVQVTENLFIGSIGAAMHRKNLLKHKITHVICCLDKDYRPFYKEMEYANIPVLDSPKISISDHFLMAWEFIDEALECDDQARIFIHW